MERTFVHYETQVLNKTSKMPAYVLERISARKDAKVE